MAAFFNSATTAINTTIMLPLYYAGVLAGGAVNISRAEPSGALFKVPETERGSGIRGGSSTVLGGRTARNNRNHSDTHVIGASGTVLVADARSRVSLTFAMPPGTYTMLLIKHAGN